jgi:murein DD-endopeptidase MepM/ murein hydrolase activator NlpD
MKRRTILFVPPRGLRIKPFKIRLSVAIIVFALILAGFAGYFIPFDSFTLNVVEQNQKKNLREQNKALLQKILTTLRLLNNLKDQIVKLDNKREQVIKIGGIDQNNNNSTKSSINFNEMKTDELLTYVQNQEKLIKSFADKNNEDNNIFDSIPVIRPVPLPYSVSKNYGSSKDPFAGKEKWHYGIDYIAESGTPVLATATGTVTRIENHPVWGKRIYVEHKRGYMTIFAHLGEVLVSQGRQVKRGEVLGTIGVSGLTSGPHVHYEIWKNGKPIDPVNNFFPFSVDSISSQN